MTHGHFPKGNLSPPTSFRVLDLFAGAAGGWTLGLHRAGFVTVAACEIVPWRRVLYAENNPHVRLYDDIRALTAGRLVSDLGFLDAVMDGAMKGRAPPDRWAGARALAMLLRSHGLTGTAALPVTYGWMMGFPPGWLARALHSAMDAGRLPPASSSKRSVTRSSRTSPKP